MTEEKRKMLLEITGDIRDEYVEEANGSTKWSWALRIAAAAAVLVLLISAVVLTVPKQTGSEPIPFFAIRAYAADGSLAILDELGDTVDLKSSVSVKFPGKNVYILDVALDDYTGEFDDFQNGDFQFRHNGEPLVPGEADEELAIDWLTEDEDGFFGYRIVGWCDDMDFIDITIRDADGIIIHRKDIMIENSGGYCARVNISYTYRGDMTTDELLAEVLNQDYFFDLAISSTPEVSKTILRKYNGGFLELEKREDTAEKLMDLYIRIMNGEEIYRSDWIVGFMLSWDEYWNQLTMEEKELLASYGMWRSLEDENESHKSIFGESFDGKELFVYELLIDKAQWSYLYDLEIAYNDTVYDSDTDHIATVCIGTDDKVGWEFDGWFEEPTEVTLTVTDPDGTVVRRDVILVTPTEDGYQIDVLETTE